MRPACKILTLFIPILIIGCGNPEAERAALEAKKSAAAAERTLSEVKNAVLAGLKDPDSAKFGQFTLDGEDFACIDVNAKNGFGGYTGMQSEVVFKKDGKWMSLGTIEYGHEVCLKIGKEMVSNWR